jgi:hypothetical protein
MVNVTDYPDEELIGYNFIPTCKKPMVWDAWNEGTLVQI